MGRKQEKDDSTRKRVTRYSYVPYLVKSQSDLSSRKCKGESPYLQSSNIKEDSHTWQTHKEDYLWGLEL